MAPFHPSIFAMAKHTGRKKTQMRMIQKSNARLVSFSKRRSGLFKKASEISTLCAVDIAIIVFSPGGKAYSFGHPCVDNVIKMLETTWMSNSDGIWDFCIHQDPVLSDLNRTYSDLLQQLEATRKKRGLKQKLLEKKGHRLCAKAIDCLNLPELLTVKAELLELKEKVSKQNERLSKLSSAIVSSGAILSALGH